MNVRRALWLTLLLPACLFPDLESLGGGADAATNDAQPHDTGAAEAGPLPDAGNDAQGWCASQDAGYRFCTDFDESTTASHDFDLQMIVGQGGQFSVTTSTFVSSPESGLAIANPFSPTQTTGVRLVKSLWPLGTTPATLTCELQWDPVALSTTTNDYAHVLAIQLYSDAAGTQQIASYSMNMNGSGLLELLEINGGQVASHPVTSGITEGTWLPVVVSFLPGQNFSVTVGNDNATGIFTYPIQTTSHGTVAIGPAYYAGNTTSASPGWTFGYDDVICY